MDTDEELDMLFDDDADGFQVILINNLSKFIYFQ